MGAAVYCITAVSGAGKDTLVQDIERQRPGWLRKFVSTTTRAQREGEVEGHDYYFVNDNVYDQWRLEGRFLLSIEYAGVRYGTLKSEVTDLEQPLVMLVVESVAAEMKRLVGAKVIVLDVDEGVAYERMTASRGDDAEAARQRVEADRPRREAMAAIADVTIPSTTREETTARVLAWMDANAEA